MLFAGRDMYGTAPAHHHINGKCRVYMITQAKVGGGVYSIFMHGRSRMTIGYRPLHTYNAGTEHVGFSPTRQTLLAPSAKRLEEFGESHEG